MKKSILIYHMVLVLQIAENSKSELVTNYIEYLLLFFCLAVPMIIMMLIPIVLFFSMVGNYIAMRDYMTKIDNGISLQEINDTSLYLESLYKKYLKSFSNFFKYFSALAAWNIFSLLYIILGFESFEVGLKEYFYFPFYVFQTLTNDEIFNSIYVFKSEGIIMATIMALTFLFFQIGKYFGLIIAKNIEEKKMVNLG